MTTPVDPPKGEISAPELSGASSLFAGGKYVELLTPADTVLRQKGGAYSVYSEVLRDDQCASCYQQRRDAVVAAEIMVEPGGKRAIDVKAADFLREQIAALQFDRHTAGMHSAVWYGHAVSELLYATDGRYITIDDIRVREVGRFKFSRDRKLYLRTETGDEPMPERKFWTVNSGVYHDDEPYGLGLAHYAYWPVFFKRNDIKFWLVHKEKFAMPTITGKAPAGQFDDDKRRAEILRQLRSFATETAILIPEGVEVDLLEATRSGTATYQELLNAMDAAISKIILSQTMTTDNGSSRSQAQVHEGVRDLVVKSDADLLCQTWNAGPATWLTEWNFPGAAVPRVWRNTEPPDDLTARAERDTKIYALGFEPTEDYVKDTYGDGWVKRGMDMGLTPQQAQQVPGQLAAEFAELGAIAALRGARRIDQQQLADAATRFADRYPEIIGARVRQVIDMAEASGDYETARRHLLEMMAEAAPAETVEPLERAGLLSRMLGLFRGQRAA